MALRESDRMAHSSSTSRGRRREPDVRVLDRGMSEGEARPRLVDRGACPSCDYPLRGLPLVEGRVICPECGGAFTLTEIVTSRDAGPWFRTPGLSVVQAPAAWAAGGLLIAAVLAPTLDWLDPATLSTPLWRQLLLGFAAGWMVVWAALVVRTFSWFGGWVGIALALGAHVMLLLYGVGLFGAIGGGLWAFHAVGQGDWTGALASGTIALICPAGLFAGRWLERYTARVCMEHRERGGA